MDQQPRVTDFIPIRHRMFALLIAGGLLMIAALEGLHFGAPHIPQQIAGGDLKALRLGGPNSLATCFTSAMLALAGLVAILVYSLRRCRVDDYKGRYRIWRWVACGCFVLSIDETAGLRHSYQSMMVQLTAQRIQIDGSLWWLGTLAAILTLVGVRLMLECRACRSSSITLAIAACLGGVTAATQLGWFPIGVDEAVMLAAGCKMAACMSVLAALTFHARYIILDIQGLLPVKAARPAIEKAKTERPKKTRAPKSDAPSSVTRIDPAHKAVGSEKRTDLDPQPAMVKATRPQKEMASVATQAVESKPQRPQPAFDAEDALEDGSDRRSSRAERKKLRKQRMQERGEG